MKTHFYKGVFNVNLFVTVYNTKQMQPLPVFVQYMCNYDVGAFLISLRIDTV